MSVAEPISMISTETRELKRGIGTRQLSMIAIGGAIGTGLFFASGGAIAQAGPGGALLAYATMGLAVYCMMQSLGEMATQLPIRWIIRGLCGAIRRSFARICGRLELLVQLGDHPGRGTGRGVADRSILVSAFQLRPLGDGIFRVLLALNLLSVKAYAEAEYWFAGIKVVTVIIFLAAAR